MDNRYVKLHLLDNPYCIDTEYTYFVPHDLSVSVKRDIGGIRGSPVSLRGDYSSGFPQNKVLWGSFRGMILTGCRRP